MSINWGQTQKHYKLKELAEKLNVKLSSVHTWMQLDAEELKKPVDQRKPLRFPGAFKPFGNRGGWLIPESAVIAFMRSRGFQVEEVTDHVGELIARGA